MHSPVEEEAIYDEAAALFRHGNLEAARLACDRALAARPTHFNWLLLGGILALEANQPARATLLLGRAILANPRNAAAHAHQGNALFDLGRYEEAIDSYGRVLSLDVYHIIARTNRGLAFWRLKQPRVAIDDFERTIAIDPTNAEAHNYRGHALRDLFEHEAAVESYDAALALRWEYPEAHNGKGGALAAQLNYSDALASFDHAIASHRNFAEAHLNRGNVLKDLGRLNDALASYDQSVALKSNFAEGHYRRGDLLRKQGRLEEALIAYDKAMALNPRATLLPGMRQQVRMQLCDWREFDAGIAELTAGIERGEAVCPPLTALSLSGSCALQHRAAQNYVHSECPPDSSLHWPISNRRSDKIRIGYFSPDFREHPVAYLTAEVFESHDRSMFEVTAFSLGPRVDDPMSRRLGTAFERFVAVPDRSDRAVAQLARELHLDIAVDLCGFTEGCRPSIFAMRAAPLQVSYIGYLGTMAAPYIDYMIADATLVPSDVRHHYAERLIYLPSYQANDSHRHRSVCDRQTHGLPPAAFVFCSFNNPIKINPTTFSGWMRILTRVPDSVLLLYASHPAVAINLRREAVVRGVNPDRLIFGGTLPRPEYLARYGVADLFLDTSPYNAGTTASDALWAGLPVLTLAGETFAGRIAASLLTAAGVPELITSTPSAYEALAVELARDQNRLEEIKRRLSPDRLRTSVLFDVRRFTRTLEAAYRTIHERHQLGLPTADLDATLPQS